jgi:hypothetical protein
MIGEGQRIASDWLPSPGHIHRLGSVYLTQVGDGLLVSSTHLRR